MVLLKWKEILILLLIAACLWLAFRDDGGETSILEREADSLRAEVTKYALLADSLGRRQTIYLEEADSLSKLTKSLRNDLNSKKHEIRNSFNNVSNDSADILLTNILKTWRQQRNTDTVGSER